MSAPADLFLPAPSPPIVPPGHYQLLGADCSYYTAKISAVLRYKWIPHVNVLATREVFTQSILPRVGWPVIPVLIAPDGKTFQDTSEMYDHLEASHPAPATLPADAPGRFLCYWLELLFDEWVKVPALHYRWNHDNDFAVTEFGRNNDPARGPAEQRAVGEKIALRFRGWLGGLGVNAASIPTIEADYLRLLAILDGHFTAHDYLLGAAPTLADFALYGPCHAHLYRDPNSGRLLRARAPRVARWIERMGAPPAVVALPTSTHVPASLLPALRQLARDYLPVLAAQREALARWLHAHHDEEIPRELGQHTVVFGRGTPEETATTRALFTYDQWMLERALAVYAHADPAARNAITQLCADLDAAALLPLAGAPLLARRNFRLVRAAGIAQAGGASGR